MPLVPSVSEPLDDSRCPAGSSRVPGCKTPGWPTMEENSENKPKEPKAKPKAKASGRKLQSKKGKDKGAKGVLW